MSESAAKTKHVLRVLVAPLAVLLFVAILMALAWFWNVKVPNVAVLFVLLMVILSLITDIPGAIVCNILALAGMLLYYTCIQESVGLYGVGLARLIIIVVALPLVTIVVLGMRRRLVKLIAAPALDQRLLFQAIMASMHDAIVETDWKGIRDVNDSFCKMTGFSRDELLGAKPPYPFWPPEQYATIAAALETSMRGQALDFELVLTRKDGVRFPVLLSVSRILDSDAVRGARETRTSRVLYSFRDITDLKRAEDTLRKQSRELEAAKEVAEIANRTKDRFLGLLSHELRSPLTPILTLATILENDQRLPADIRSDMQTIRRNAEHEGRLIEDMLELVRVAKGTLPADVETSVRDVRRNIAEARLANGPGAAAPVPLSPPASSKSLRILLVEDHNDTARVLSRVLTESGHTVTVADTMQSGVDIAARGSFDFLICDIGLPDGSGLELMDKIRKVRPIPGIVLSGYTDRDDIQRSRDAGFLEHLTKPVDVRILCQTIDRLAALPR